MASVRSSTSLNEYVLREIFSFVVDASYPTIHSLLLTSHLFYDIARPLLYRYIGLNLYDDSFVEEIQSWLTVRDKSAIPKFIRHISIYYDAEILYLNEPEMTSHFKASRSRPSMKVIRKSIPRRSLMDSRRTTPEPRNKAAEWVVIAALISQTSQLRSVTFSAYEAIPVVLLQSIHCYPTLIHLDIANWTRAAYDLSPSDPAELELLSSRSLRSLKANITNPESTPHDLRRLAFWRLVKSAPNLQSVMLHVNHFGCVITSPDPEEIREWESMTVEFRRTALGRGNLPSSIRNLRIVGNSPFDLSEEELANVAHLDCSLGSFPPHFVSTFASLSHLTLRSGYRAPNMIDDFLVACHPLSSLSLIGWNTSQLSIIISRHGPSLRALALHEFENTDVTNPRKVLSKKELSRIKSSCINLEDFAMDINFPEDRLPEFDRLDPKVHEGVYQALSTFSSLRRIQINVNLGIATFSRRKRLSRRESQKDGNLLPVIDKTFVHEVWAAVNHGRAAVLQELRVAQGESQRPTSYGYPAHWVHWEDRSHGWFKATLSDVNDEPGKVVISAYRDVPDFAEDVWREYR